MIESAESNSDLRVLVLAPTAKDAVMTQSILARADMECVCCPNLEQLCAELESGAGTVLLTEESVANGGSHCLADWLREQPAWSDMPVLVLARPGADSTAVAQAMDQLGNVTVLERPSRVAALVSALRTALRSRRRQYQTRRHLAGLERGNKAKALLAAIVASSNDAIISKTLDGDILTWNAAAERLFGYTAAEAIGQSILLLIPPERQAEEPALLQRLRRGERIEHFETVRIAKDGRRIDVSLTISPVRDANGKIIAASKIARDITRSKREAEELRAAREQLQVVTDNMAAVVSRCSRDMRYLWVSGGWASWLRRQSHEVVGKPIREVLGEAAFESIRPHVEQVLTGRRVEFEEKIPYRGLGPRWVKVVYDPVHDHRGEVDGWVAVITDTTAHHSMEEALRDADRRKDEFLAVLAHELRNPLAPIRNAVQILKPPAAAEEEEQWAWDVIERQVGQMTRLIDDLLDVSRISRDKLELRRERVELAKVIRAAVETSRPLIDESGHRLSVDLPPEPVYLDADPIRLAQIFSNLLNNAAKYSERSEHIEVSAKLQDGQVLVSVRDEGIGIPSEQLTAIFDMFAQVRDAVDRSKGGLGIGLSLVKRLVEMHGGTIAAASDGVGKGSTFTVRLPVAPSVPQVVKKAPATIVDPPSPSLRILVVDDNQDAALSLSMLLRMKGNTVRTAHDGEEAIRIAGEFLPDVAFLDIGLPRMSGYDACREIRTLPWGRKMTLVAVTGWGQEADKQRSREAGFDSHLVKPVDPQIVMQMLSSLRRIPI